MNGLPGDRLALPSLPITAWPSLLSLDAVFVALAWQQLLLWSFCHRAASWLEMVSLAAAVWLIYVADRLLDAASLRLDQPHTLRHRFYLTYNRTMLLLWVIVLICATVPVVRYLPSELLRGGLLLACAVLAYGAHIHLAAKIRPPSNRPRWRVARCIFIPKEIRVGTLFALGVALTTFTQLAANSPLANSSPTRSGWRFGSATGQLGVFATESLISLAATTAALALLFSCNCMLVARFERDLDRAQAFASVTTQPSRWSVGCWPLHQKFHAAQLLWTCLPVVLLILWQLPGLILIAIGASTLGLVVSITLPDRAATSLPLPAMQTAFDIRSVWVDAALGTPPVVVLNLF